MQRLLALLCLCLVTAGGCSSTPSSAPAASPSPLAERIFSAPAGAEMDRDELVRRMLAARVVYLGEKHDSRRHHEIQLSLLEELVARGARPALGLEMFPRERTAALMGYVGWQPPAHAAIDAGNAENWLRARLGGDDDASRPSTWDAYAELLAAARRHRLVLFGIDLPLSLRARISGVGIDGLSHVERAALSPTGFDDDTYRSLMQQRIKTSHCGFGSQEQLGRLYDNWVARNDAMARAILAALDDTPDGPVVVIVGAGHLEHDMGVVERVAALAPGIKQLNLAMRDLAGDPIPLAEHFAPLRHEDRQFAPDHGYLWFTEAAEEAVDYCAGFAGVASEAD